MKIIWLVILWVKFILWVIINMVILEFLVIFFIMFNILLIILGFSVEVGLLNKRYFGFIVKECVIVICCDCLLDNWFGKLLVLLVRLILFNKFIVNFLFLFFGCFKINWGVIMIFLSIVLLVYKLKCWNIILMFLWILFIFVLWLVKLNLLISNWFDWICFKLLMVWIKVFLFELDGLIKIIFLFLLIVKLIFLRVWKLL